MKQPRKLKLCTAMPGTQFTPAFVFFEVESHAAKADAKVSAEEAEKLRRQSTSHAATLRRYKARQQLLENALVSMKHDLEASQERSAQAQSTTVAAKAKTEAATRRVAAAEERVKTAQADVAAEVDKVAAVREESRAMLASMQEASYEALRSTEAAASEQVHRLTLQVTEMESENKLLKKHLQDARERARLLEQQQLSLEQSCRDTPAEVRGALVVSGEASKASDVITGLQHRNHQLQMALAKKLVAEVGVCCLPTFFVLHVFGGTT
jgi:chromosome segregation ATPase